MYAHDDPNIIWVAPEFEGRSTGTFDAPFTDVSMAVKKAQPGNTVVLKAGEYRDSVSIHNSGTLTKPVRIVSDNVTGPGVYCYAGWYLYDVSDLIVSGITFKDISHQAISVIGACERNSFTSLRFVNCGLGEKTACTFFFGGSGAQCNVVENCIFEIDQCNYADTISDLPIGLMISQGDTEEDAKPNTNHIFRRNRFLRYGCAIIVGTHDEESRSYSHIVESNSIRYCSSDGIRIKCGDTIVRDNVIQHCRKNGISVIHGRSDTISNNRIEECKTGIHIAGYDCTLTNNCIIRSGEQAVLITAKSIGKQLLRGDTSIELNTCIDSGKDCNSVSCRNIMMDTDSYCIIRRNVFHGKGKPYSIMKKKAADTPDPGFYVDDNIASDGCSPVEGCNKLNISFIDSKSDNYTNQSGYGASGWMVENPKIPFQDSIEYKSYQPVIGQDSTVLENSVGETDMYLRSLFINAQQGDDEEEEDFNSGTEEDDGIIDFSDWD